MAVEFMETLKENTSANTGLSPNTLFTLFATGVTVYYMVSVFFRGSSDHRQQHTPISSEEEDVQSRSMASSSSSSHSLKYEVFLSFRGEDTRKNFVDHLYEDLVQQGIQTYKDDETLPRGERIGPALLKAIEESRIALVVFSKDYADSSWCLDELAHIMECVDTRGQIVMPVFYHVDPSDVRKQNGKYGKAFSKHERKNKQKVESWRKALEKAGNLSGWVINDTQNSYEAKCIKEIVYTISKQLPTLTTNVNKNIIGIEARLRDLKSKLKIGSDGVRIVGIWGVGGGGKTTLASAAYAELSHQFEAHCLLQNIREESNKHGLEKLQEKILSLALKTKDIVVGSEIEGRSTIERKLRSKRVLVVLDDVDDRKQVEELAGSQAWFGEGSRIIITTRDEHLLTRHADEVYEVSLLSHDEAMELFRRHAYRKDKPIEDYEMLSEEVVSYAGGLPLALEVLGSFLYDKNKDEWKCALARLKDIPNDEVMERLKISYDGLTPDEKVLFLDIACFFRGEDKDEAMKVLDACDLHPVIGLKVLVQKSLIKVSGGRYGRFEMHDLIEEMAHYIVRGEHPKHPEKHSRILKKKDLAYLCDLGANAPPMETEVLLYNHLGLSHVVANMKKLRWIRLYDYPASSFPSNFQPKELRYLKLKRSQQKELWHGYKFLPNLKILNLGGSGNLITTPDFDGLPRLERLILSHCKSLEEIHPSIGYHKRFVFVNLTCCSSLKRFPPIIHMKKLETLYLSGCQELQQFPDIQSNMDSLVTLDLSGTGIEIIPPSVGRFCTNLVSLDLSDCRRLKMIVGNFHLVRSLKYLNLSYCEELQSFHQDRLASLNLPQFPRSLRELDLSDCNLGDGDIPSDICELLNLQLLYALEKAGNLSGWVINDTENSYETKCIKEIVDTISNRLHTLTTNANKNLIGIEARLRDLKSKLKIGSDGVSIVGIWGVGGGGKTTLASAAYAELSHYFEAHCLLQNIREESNKHGLEKLQEKFLSLVLKTKDVLVGSEIEGRNMIERGLRNKSVLVVLDDVDDLKQLQALAGSHAWFGKGSRIIITTRDKHLLTRHADTIYEVSLLSEDEAMELFNKHANRKDKPIEDYGMLSKDVVSYACGLPLALEILGSFLYDKNKDEWKSALAKLKCIPEYKVMERLKISYDGLTAEQKVLFLDIACCFRGEDKDKAMMVLDACDLHPGIGIKVLVQKSLIKVSKEGRFEMHDLIEEMAHYIVRGEHPNNPEKHSRILKKI